MQTYASFIRKIAKVETDWADKIQKKYGISCACSNSGEVLDPVILKKTFGILSGMPSEFVKDCEVKEILFSSSMGPNLPYYPSHGYYRESDQSVTMNVNVYYHPDMVEGISREEETLVHEFFHAFDAKHNELSLKPDWINLSGWSETKKPGLKRMVINEPKLPPKIGEWYYDPKAGYTRFYSKMNPWDDMADSASFYLLSRKDKLPANKTAYFDKLLKKYL